MRAMQTDYEQQIEFRDAEINALHEAREKHLGESVNKYEQRIALLKKIHEDQLAEVKRAVADQEREIEDKIYQFNKHKEAVYEKARLEVKEEERLRFEKQKGKLERVKEKEIALARRDHKKQITLLQSETEALLKRLEAYEKRIVEMQQLQMASD
jgi:hypothetical protein